jgi:hypothetical protein
VLYKQALTNAYSAAHERAFELEACRSAKWQGLRGREDAIKISCQEVSEKSFS